MFQWDFIWNTKVFVQENALGFVVCKIATILSQPQIVNMIDSIAYFSFGFPFL